MALAFDDHTGDGWKLPFSIIRRFSPKEYQQFETAVNKLVEAVKGMNLEGIDYASRNFLSKKADLLEALQEAMVEINPLLEDDLSSNK